MSAIKQLLRSVGLASGPNNSGLGEENEKVLDEMSKLLDGTPHAYDADIKKDGLDKDTKKSEKAILDSHVPLHSSLLPDPLHKLPLDLRPRSTWPSVLTVFRIVISVAAVTFAIYRMLNGTADSSPALTERGTIAFQPHPVVPPPGSSPVRLKSFRFDQAKKTFSGEIWVENIADTKLVEVFWSTPTAKWTGNNGFNASYAGSADNGYEIWRFSGIARSADVGSQFYVKYRTFVKNKDTETYYDNNGGSLFNYAIDVPASPTPVQASLNECVGNGVQRKLFTSAPRYLVAEVLSDNVIHFEAAETSARKPNPKLKIHNSPMVDTEENLEKRFCGPTSFTETSTGFETATVRVIIDSASLSVTLIDKAKNQVLTTYSYAGLNKGKAASRMTNPSEVQLKWTREATENIYGVAGSPSYGNQPWGDKLTSEGDWFGKSITAFPSYQGGEGFGNTLVWVQRGSMVYAQLPVVYSVGTNYQHAFFVDDQHRLDWDFSQSTHSVTSRGGRALRWYAIAGNSLLELRKTYMRIVGPQVVGPKAAFGLQVCKYGYKSWEEAKDEIKGLVDNGFPLDAIIFDLYWFGGTWNGFGKLAWDTARFPNPNAHLKEIRASGPGTILIEEPYIETRSTTFNMLKDRGGLVKAADNTSVAFLSGWWGQGGYVDHTANASLLWSVCKRCKLIEGCKPECPVPTEYTDSSAYIVGHWQDLGEPENYLPDANYAGLEEDDGFRGTTHRAVTNMYQLLKTKRTWELYRNQSLARRAMVLTRTVVPGMQRYGGLTWSGDIPSHAPAVASSFGTKKDYIMAGMDMHSSDIGGHQRIGCDPRDCDIHELYKVWYASSTWFDIPVRPHVNADHDYAKNFTASPAVMGHVPSNLFNTQTRYFLLPLYYSLAHKAYRDGEPIISPIFLRFPDDKNVRQFGGQYMIGPIMVAFTVDYSIPSRGVYLPANTEWYNFHTHQHVVGSGAYVETSFFPFGNNIFTLPALVQAGSIFPTSYVDTLSKNSRWQDRRDNTIVHPLQVRVYPGPRSTFLVTDDDGESQNYLSGLYTTYELVQEMSGNTVTVTVGAAQGYFPGQNTRRQLVVEVVLPKGFSGVSAVTIDGVAVSPNPSASAVNAEQGYKLFGQGKRMVGVYGSVGSVFTERQVVINLTK
ncbi:hypothetical protein HDU96_007371 [Phlyctochytrium bullatum]|nr:hypothetical protein HDU96_007371 [Phlyctochytrium bullatum]